ncbi:MAG: phosphatase PAP2 family protein [Bacteroidales bacterium]|jgi:undecaprenyl-diphosphatase|nr:phosphatase PAP2 family protein [Bacteroidales bacterium]
MDKLIEFDIWLFYLINGARSNFADWFFSVISSHLFFGLVVFFLVLGLSVSQFKKRFWHLLILVAVCFLLADRISVLCFKDVFMRLRPSHALEGVNLVKFSDFQLIYDSKGGLYGFVSSHATNAFCLATVFAKLSRKRNLLIPILIVWGLLTMYSRVYCGVHYPTDVLCGAILGIAIGLLISYIYELLLRNKRFKNQID